MAVELLAPIRARRHGARRKREQRFSVRAFYLTCLIFTVLALISFWPERQWGVLSPNEQGRLYSRDLEPFSKSDEECRLVHKTKVMDKCAFVRKHCPSEEPGFLAYLDLYYCQLGSAKPVAFVLMVFWMGMLFSTIGIAASDFFCINLSTLATLLGMSESLAGVTFLAFGNGSPDVFSTFAAMSTNSSSLAIGELFGAAGFITGVVAGSMALVRPFKVARKSFIRDVTFFTVAAAFSMGFLSDGRLHLWECASMVIFYVFYVCVVVIWHWYITQRVRRRERDAAARGHFITPGSEEIDVQDEYRDDPEESSRPSISRGVSADDFRILEDGGIPRIEEPDIDDDEDLRDRWLGEIQTNMRLNRRTRGRSNTITPVRPSLVGALEFQSVLRALNKSRNIQRIPMHTRRYSDDPTYILAQQPGAATSSLSTPTQKTLDAANSLAASRPGRLQLSGGSGRVRAVSVNDAANVSVDTKFLQSHAKQQPPLLGIHEDEGGRLMPPSPTSSGAVWSPHPSPMGLATPTEHAMSPLPPSARPRSDTLAPPGEDVFTILPQPSLGEPYFDESTTAHASRPRLPSLRIPSGTKSPRGSNPPSPFPAYHDNFSSPSTRAPSLFLPPPSISVDSRPFLPEEDHDVSEDVRPPTWWPSTILPSPAVLGCTLVPTLYHWRGKSWFERCLGLIAAPSVLLLTLTLPVVDSEGDEDEDDEPQGAHISVTNYDDSGPSKRSTPVFQVISPVNDGPSNPSGPGTGAAGVATKVEQNHTHSRPAPAPTAELGPLDMPIGPDPKTWNRWLTITQLYLAPLMIVLIIYTQYIPPGKHHSLSAALVRPVLIAVLISTMLLVPLLATTTPTHRPTAFLPILSLAGFVVSIAWISTIASQVVAVIKAFAIILNMSHAILGLTVFAVGNSLGDLVADITVARLGYPVMALSACFGGPMLNILLGIGLSGCWILFRGAQKRHAKHPDREWESGTYEIEVGDTLIVSGVTLLITLVGLLVAVPMNGWVMSRRIAYGLIGLWCVGTMVNVILEVVGVGGKKEGE